MRLKFLMIATALIAVSTSAFAQNGLFGVAGIKIQQDAEKRFSLNRDEYGGVGLYAGVGKEFELLSWLSVSPVATVTIARVEDSGYVPDSKNSAAIDFQLSAPVNFKIPLAKEGRFFYIGAGPSVTFAALDDRDYVKKTYGGVALRIGADISDKLYFGADANFGLTKREERAFSSSLSLGLAWKF